MVISPNIKLPIDAMASFCARHGITKLSLFGSFSREEAGAESDLDLLVEFVPGRRVSLFDIGEMTMELREMTGRAVDLRTAEDLSPYFRDDVLRNAKVIYAT